jgi:hypothetical protein
MTTKPMTEVNRDYLFNISGYFDAVFKYSISSKITATAKIYKNINENIGFSKWILPLPCIRFVCRR